MAQPTYQLGPLDNEKFIPSKIDRIVALSVDKCIASSLDANSLSEKVRDAVASEGGISRHRIIVFATVAEIGGQPLLVASKSLWDSNTDNYSCYTTKSADGKFFISVTVFCVYKE